jgi:hypothetical protein
MSNSCGFQDDSAAEGYSIFRNLLTAHSFITQKLLVFMFEGAE